MKIILASVLAAILLAAAGPIKAQPMAPLPHAFGDGERLAYNVSWSTINVMRVTVRTNREDIGGRPHYHITGNGTTTGAARTFFTLNDTYHTWLDGSSLLPSRMTADLQENDYRHRATYNYDWSAMSVGIVRRNARWDADKHSALPLKTNSGDAVSLLFRLRQLDVSKLVRGKAYPLDLVLDTATRPIYFKFMGREEVRVKRVGLFRALKFSCTLATSDGSSYKEGMTLTVWISDDANKIPLLVESPIRVGKVRVTLAKGYKVLHPLESLIED